MKRTPGLLVVSTLMGVSELLAQTASVPQTTVSAAATAATAATVRVVPASTVGVAVTPPTLPPTVRPGTTAEARLVNLSTRARVTAASPLIAGFAISGRAPRTVLVRAAGPALAGFGVTDVMATPQLALRTADGSLVTENTGWADSAALAASFAQAGAFPFARGSADSAAVVTLAPGNYTVQVGDASGRGGVTLAEIYDVGGAGDSRLVNVSTRTTVSAAGGELISGFVIGGTAPRDFLLRGVGPGLAKFGVSGALIDPILSLFDTSGRQVATNDNWSGTVSAVTASTSGSNPNSATQVVSVAQVYFPPLETQVAAATAAAAPIMAGASATGAFALELFSRDAALVKTLAPGAYTVQVRGADVITPTMASATNAAAAAVSGAGTTFADPGTRSAAQPGLVLLEIYELP